MRDIADFLDIYGIGQSTDDRDDYIRWVMTADRIFREHWAAEEKKKREAEKAKSAAKGSRKR